MQEITSIVISYLIPTFLGGVIGWLTTKVKKAKNAEEIKKVFKLSKEQKYKRTST